MIHKYNTSNIDNSFNTYDIFDADGLYCDSCDLCIRNSMTPGRGNGVVRSGTILHLVAAPSPADNKSKLILSGNTGKLIRRILDDKGLLKYSYFTSVVKCGIYPQLNATSIKACFPRLQKEISFVNPSMIIVYGKNPYYVIKGSQMPNDEGIELLNNNKILIHTISLEYMKFKNDYSYLDRAYDVAADAYIKFINKWVLLR